MRITYQQKHTSDITAANHADLASKFVEASLDSEGKKIEAGEDNVNKRISFSSC